MTAARTVEVYARAPVPAKDLWRVLADPWSWSRWVSGSRRICGADSAWPAPGSRLFHRWGPGVLSVRDHTTVLVADPPSRMIVEARARPWGEVRAEIRLVGDGSETVISLREDAVSGLVARLPRLGQIVQRRRNRRSVQSLVRLVSGGP